MSWREFFSGEHSIYANARHKTLHADIIARAIIGYNDHAEARVLDYGCGEALGARAVAEHCGSLYLYDVSPFVRTKLQKQFGDDAKIVILDDEGFAKLPTASLDVIVANSVLQYLDEAECARLTGRFATRLKPGGRLVLGDVLPPALSALEDTRALLKFAFRGGFLFAALISLMKTALSGYRQTRARYGLTRYSEAAMLELLRDHGFNAVRASSNIGHNQQRMTFVATPDASD